MADTKLLATLKDMGLSDNEASVYLSSLSLGPSTIQRIANNAKVKRTTVYTTIDTLKQKGLMNIEVKNKKKQKF